MHMFMLSTMICNIGHYNVNYHYRSVCTYLQAFYKILPGINSHTMMDWLIYKTQRIVNFEQDIVNITFASSLL